MQNTTPVFSYFKHSVFLSIFIFALLLSSCKKDELNPSLSTAPSVMEVNGDLQNLYL